MHSQQETNTLPLLTVWFCRPGAVTDDVTQVQAPGSEPRTFHERYQLTSNSTFMEIFKRIRNIVCVIILSRVTQKLCDYDLQ